MPKLAVARHGETVCNAAKVVRGRTRANLNEAGIEQAALMGKCLSNWKLDVIRSNPLRRALDTANIVARYQEVAVRIAEDLIDSGLGEWQSWPGQEVNRVYPAIFREWHHDPHKIGVLGGESLEDAKKRAANIVNDAPSRHQGSVLLVSHAVLIKVLICCLLGLDHSHFWNISQDVGGITVIDCTDGSFILIRHNDTSHLPEVQGSVLGRF